MKKAISFKRAFVLVIGLHIIGLFGLYGYSKYNAYIAKKIRGEKREHLLTVKRDIPWHNEGKRPLVVARPRIIKETNIAEKVAEPKKIVKVNPPKSTVKFREISNMTREEKLEEIKNIKAELARRGRFDIIQKYENSTL